MTKDGVIVDTSVLIDFLIGTEPQASEITKLLEQKQAVTTGIIIAELLQGIKNLKEEHNIAELLTALHVKEISTAIWIRAGNLSLSLRKKGVNLPLTDIAIAALSIEYNLPIFTYDKHFNQIPDVRLYQT